MNILLFGPPGAGKGTQSAMLVKNKGLKHICTGDLFRNAIKSQTTLGLEAKKFMDQGDLVPDSIVIGMVEEELQKDEGKDFVLDGFPRTVPQAEALDYLLSGMNLVLERVIFLEVPEESLVARLSGRRICRGCGAVFHVTDNPPSKEALCDNCGGELYQREDDQESVIKNRLDVYKESTEPLKSFYFEKGKLVEVDGRGSTAEVFDRIEKIIG